MARQWHDRTDLPWSKVWQGWWQSLSHAELSAAGIGIGIYLQTVANQRGRAADGSGWVVATPGGPPLSVAAIARGAHATVQEVQEAIDQLLAAGTLVRREDGAVGFPHLQRFQETADASRARSRRGKGEDEDDDAAPVESADSPPESTSDIPRNVRGQSADSPADSPAESTPQTSEDQRIRGSEDQRGEGSARRPGRARAQTADLTPIVDAWNRGLDEAQEDLGHPPKVSRAVPGNLPQELRAACRDHPDPEAWRWCAYALATSWEATKADDAFQGFGLAWVVALNKKRRARRMAQGVEARERGRAVVQVHATPVADVWEELVKLVKRTPRHQRTPVEGPVLDALRAIGGANEIRAADERRLVRLRGDFLDAYKQAKLAAPRPVLELTPAVGGAR